MRLSAYAERLHLKVEKVELNQLVNINNPYL